MLYINKIAICYRRYGRFNKSDNIQRGKCHLEMLIVIVKKTITILYITVEGSKL